MAPVCRPTISRLRCVQTAAASIAHDGRHNIQHRTVDSSDDVGDQRPSQFFLRVTQIVGLLGATLIADISCGRVQVACGHLGPPLRVRGMPELRPVVSRRLRSLAMAVTL